jgi:uncharacterized membrane protein
MNLPALIVHIVGGTVALSAGAAALWFRKGGTGHARAGTIFFGAMFVLTASGWLIASLKPDWGTAAIAIFTAYLVVSARVSARRRDGKPGRIVFVGCGVAIACALAFLWLGLFGGTRPNALPPAADFPFAGLAALAVALDLNFILRGAAAPPQRIARHVWRMCTALLIAAISFFVGQQKVMPVSWRGSLLLLMPPLTVFVLMLFWLMRLRFGPSFTLLTRQGRTFVEGLGRARRGGAVGSTGTRFVTTGDPK